MIKVQEGQKSKCNQPLSAPLTSPLGGQNSQTSFHCGQLKHLHVPDRLVIGGFVHLDEALKKERIGSEQPQWQPADLLRKEGALRESTPCRLSTGPRALPLGPGHPPSPPASLLGSERAWGPEPGATTRSRRRGQPSRGPDQPTPPGRALRQDLRCPQLRPRRRPPGKGRWAGWPWGPGPVGSAGRVLTSGAAARKARARGEAGRAARGPRGRSQLGLLVSERGRLSLGTGSLSVQTHGSGKTRPPGPGAGLRTEATEQTCPYGHYSLDCKK
ncbi:laforin-like [Lontra canadensis]|uniref:laforin-like n=1 Tax=Lontra canadensis TaxID=76717 RepID=UPI0013F2EBD6|nr:laforin-like [Lontra canadensis]